MKDEKSKKLNLYELSFLFAFVIKTKELPLVHQIYLM